MPDRITTEVPLRAAYLSAGARCSSVGRTAVKASIARRISAAADAILVPAASMCAADWGRLRGLHAQAHSDLSRLEFNVVRDSCCERL